MPAEASRRLAIFHVPNAEESRLEATVKEAKRGMRNNKVRVRRRISVSLHMIFTAIGINLTRIHQKMVVFHQKYTDRPQGPHENNISIVKKLKLLMLELKIYVYYFE